MTPAETLDAYRRLFHAVPGLLVVLRPDLTVIDATDAYLAATRLLRDDLVGRDLCEVIASRPPGPSGVCPRKLRESLLRAIATRAVDAMPMTRTEAKVSDGVLDGISDGAPSAVIEGRAERFWRSVNSAVVDGHGEVELVLHRVEDVTQIVRAEAARQAHEQLGTILEKMPVGVIVVVPPDADILMSNSQAAALWHAHALTRSGAERHRDYVAYHPDGRRYQRDEWPTRRALRGEVIVGEEMHIRRADGSPGWISCNAGPIRAADGTVRIGIATLLDMTDRKAAEAAAEKSRLEAESASRTKDEFLAVLGHELRNPLAPLFTALHLMRVRGSPQIEREMGIFERQLKHLTRLIDDLLDVSRITRGGLELARERVELSEIAERALELAGPALEKGGRNLAVDIAPAGLAVDGDPTRLVQVFVNLLTNAVKYTQPGGHITFSARLEGGEVVARVADDGVGIAAEFLPRIFDQFVQSPQTIDRAEGGLGLGLTIVRSLVGMHGGSVQAASDGPGKGSVLTVRLPAAGPAPAREASPAPPVPRASAHPGRCRVLVVDDNEDSADLVATALEADGYVTAVAHDAPEALRVAAEFAPDIAVLDIGLPIMDGYELARRLRGLPGYEGLPLVAMTGYGQASDRDRSREAGFGAHLVKPVMLDRLSAVVHELLGTPAA